MASFCVSFLHRQEDNGGSTEQALSSFLFSSFLYVCIYLSIYLSTPLLWLIR